MSLGTSTRPATPRGGGAPAIRVRYVYSGRILAGLVVVHFVIAALDAATHVLEARIGSDELRRVFDVDAESSLPTWVSSSQALVAAGLLALIAAYEGLHSRQASGSWQTHGQSPSFPPPRPEFFPNVQRSLHTTQEGPASAMSPSYSPSQSFPRKEPGGSWGVRWLGLAFVFLAISVEEIAGLHETATLATGTEFPGLGGASWVVAGAVLGSALFVLYLPFLRHLPADTLHLVLAAAALTVGGAMGVEVVSALTIGAGAPEDGTLVTMLLNIEELLERVGVALFIYALLRHVAQHTTLARLDIPAERLTLVLD